MTHTDIESRMRDIADILQGALASLGGMILRTGGRLSFLLIAGNLYGAARFGTLTYTLVVVETLAAFSVFGFKRSLFPMLSNTDDNDSGRKGPSRDQLVLNALLLSLFLSLAMAALLMLFWSKFGLARPHALGGWNGRLFALVIPVIALTDVLLAATRHYRIVRFEVISRSIAEPWALAGLAAIFYFLGLLEWGLLAAYFGALVVALLIAAYGFGRLYDIGAITRAGASKSLMRSIAFRSGPTALVDVVAILFRRIDIVFLWYFTSKEIVGAYGVAQQIASHVQKTRGVFDPILAPVVAQTGALKGAGESGRQLGQICRWAMTIMLLQAVLVGFYADFALEIFGDDIAIVAIALVILLIAEAIDGTLASTELPIVFRKPYLNLGLSVLGISVHIIGCSLLVPRFGPEGAAMSLLMALIVLNAARLLVCRVELGISILGLRYLKPIAAALAAMGAVISLDQWLGVREGWHIALGAASILVVYGLGLRALGWSQEDRDLVDYLRGRKKAT